MFKEVLCFSPWINQEELVQSERFVYLVSSSGNYSYTQPCSSSLLHESPCSSGSCGMPEQVQGTAERGLRAAPSWHSLAVRAPKPGRRHPDAERPHVQLCLLPSGMTRFRFLRSWNPANFQMHLVGCKFQPPTSAAGIRNRSDAGN